MEQGTAKTNLFTHSAKHTLAVILINKTFPSGLKENLRNLKISSPPGLSSYQKGTEHVEADKVDEGKMAAAVVAGIAVGRTFLTRPSERARQHDLLPGLTCRASDGETCVDTQIWTQDEANMHVMICARQCTHAHTHTH